MELLLNAKMDRHLTYILAMCHVELEERQGTWTQTTCMGVNKFKVEGGQNTTDACLRLKVTVVLLNLHVELNVEKEERVKASLLTLCLHVQPWTIVG